MVQYLNALMSGVIKFKRICKETAMCTKELCM